MRGYIIVKSTLEFVILDLDKNGHSLISLPQTYSQFCISTLLKQTLTIFVPRSWSRGGDSELFSVAIDNCN